MVKERTKMPPRSLAVKTGREKDQQIDRVIDDGFLVCSGVTGFGNNKIVDVEGIILMNDNPIVMLENM